MRVEWPSIFQGDSLLSYAALMKLDFRHHDSEFRMYGFGKMLTFPPFRRQGWGQKVLEAATEFIHHGDADVSSLFCDPSLEPVYARHGWITTHSPTRLGQPDRFEEYSPSRMMRFISEKGRANKESFETEPVYIDWPS